MCELVVSPIRVLLLTCSQIGHLEVTAGLAGLIKGIYILERALISANIHFQQANSRIPFEKWKIAVSTETKSWPVKGLRRLGVSHLVFCLQGYKCNLEQALMLIDRLL